MATTQRVNAGWNIFGNTAPMPRSTAPALSQPQQFFGRTPDATEVLRPINLPRVPGADPAIYQQFVDAEAMRQRLFGDVNAYRNALNQSLPRTAGFTAQEQQDISNIFSPGGYESQFAGIRDRRAASLSDLNNVILNDMRRQLGIDAVGRGGVSGAGLGSYLSTQAASEAGRLRAAEAYDRAAQERADLAALMAGRAASIGRRSALEDTNLARLMNPAAMEGQAASLYNTAFANALQNALANIIAAYGIQY